MSHLGTNLWNNYELRARDSIGIQIRIIMLWINENKCKVYSLLDMMTQRKRQIYTKVQGANIPPNLGSMTSDLRKRSDGYSWIGNLFSFFCKLVNSWPLEDPMWAIRSSLETCVSYSSGVGRNSWWRGFQKKMVNYYNIWWRFLVVSKICFFTRVKKIYKFLILFFSRVQFFLIMSKNFSSSSFFSHVQKIAKTFLKILHQYINFPYLLWQYLRILTHPIIHFYTVSNFFDISQKKILLRPNGGF